jgi:glycine C-acetyltransferase
MLEQNQNRQRIQLLERNQKLEDRVSNFNELLVTEKLTYLRSILSASDREVTIKDPFTGKQRKMLMFASNNYLGLANHIHVKLRVKKAVDEYGCGIGGPPLLNGYVKLIEETETQLSLFKNQEATMLFSSGFMANLALVGTLAQQHDLILYDELSHISFYDGLKLTKAKSVKFSHNNIHELELELIQNYQKIIGDIYVCVEGVYSMDGDLAKLDEISNLCQKYNAKLIVDDAHGTGVLGKNGSGTASLFDCSDSVFLNMGTFSKVFSVCGGFLTGAQDVINYLRFHAHPYVFSASIPPTVAAAVLGGLEVMKKEPHLQLQLLDNVKYAVEKLKDYEFCAQPEAAIITLKLPVKMNIRKAAYLFHQKNIFINAIEYPAVAINNQRFRISFMATHTKKDIDKLIMTIMEVWNNKECYL